MTTTDQGTLFPNLETGYTSRVYFGLGDDGRVKIGLTSRTNGHRGGEMHFFELCCVPGDRLVEKRYHHTYDTERIGQTEWFYLSDRLLLDLYDMCSQQGRHKSMGLLRAMMLIRFRRAA